MLKGTTRIELTDVNTGEVETYQNSNMVTNALRDILKPLGLSKRPNRFLNEFVPYYETCSEASCASTGRYRRMRMNIIPRQMQTLSAVLHMECRTTQRIPSVADSTRQNRK